MSGLSSFEDLEREIEKTKEEFYSTSGKNSFFKKQQKFDCAKQIIDKISLETLLNRTCYTIPDTNMVHIDYTIMKTFASPEIFDTISDYIINRLAQVEDQYGILEVALNFDGFTISAAERYKDLIKVFCNHCLKNNTDFSITITRFVIYNSPSIIDNVKHIFIPFVEDSLKPKIILVAKKDSEPFRQLYAKYGIGV
jgi:hypothetical protein